MAKKFTPEQTLLLVALYREHECLWNIHTESYKSSAMRRHALSKISSSIGIEGLTPDDIKNKIKSLRSTYYLELDKIQKSKSDYKYKPKVPWFELMHGFIKNVLVKRKPVDIDGNELKSSVHEEDQETTNDENDDVIEEHLRDVIIKQEQGTESPDYEVSAEDPIDTEPKAKRHKQLPEPKLTSVKVRDDEDEYDIFGKHVASQLRKLSQLQYILAQGEIQNTITKCRLRDLSGSKDQNF